MNFRLGAGGTSTERSDGDLSRRMLQSWLLASLRFAVTRQPDDRLAMLAIAAELDRGAGDCDCLGQHFAFFRRSTVAVCEAVAAETEASRSLVLQQHLARIPEDRLRRAFAAAVGIEPATKQRKRNPKKGLWDGLDKPRMTRKAG